MPEPVSTAAALWPDPDSGPWRLYLDWRVIDGRQEVVGITLSSVRDDEVGWRNPPEWAAVEPTPIPLKPAVLRRIAGADAGEGRTFRELVAETRRSLADEFLPWWAALEPDRLKELTDRVLVLKAKEQTRRGRKPLDPEKLMEAAGVYEAALLRGEHPTQAVADHFVMSRDTAAAWVSKARRLGFLGPTTRGRAGGIRPTRREDEEK